MAISHTDVINTVQAHDINQYELTSALIDGTISNEVE